MTVTIYDNNRGNIIGCVMNDSNGGLNALSGGIKIARYDIGQNITENYITKERESGNTLNSCLKEYNLRRV